MKSGWQGQDTQMPKAWELTARTWIRTPFKAQMFAVVFLFGAVLCRQWPCDVPIPHQRSRTKCVQKKRIETVSHVLTRINRRPDDGGSSELRSGDKRPAYYVVLQARRKPSSYSLPREPQILLKNHAAFPTHLSHNNFHKLLEGTIHICHKTQNI